ncbi:MAG: hypothetical protein ACLUUO_14990 [Sellimonas intestinalis]
MGELKKRQLEVMDVLWEADEPMIASEIVKGKRGFECKYSTGRTQKSGKEELY